MSRVEHGEHFDIWGGGGDMENNVSPAQRKFSWFETNAASSRFRYISKAAYIAMVYETKLYYMLWLLYIP